MPSPFPTIVSAVEQLKLSLRAKSPRTRSTYSTGLNSFIKYLSDAGIDPQTDNTSCLQDNVLEEYYLWLVDRYGRDSLSTVNTYMAPARAFARFLARNDLCPNLSLVKSLERLKAVVVSQQYRTPRVDSNLALIVDFALSVPLPARTNKNHEHRLRLLRDQGILHLLYSTGLRRTEVTALDRRDIEHRPDGQTIIQGKGGKERVVFFDKECLYQIRQYIDERQDTYTPLFVRHKGTPSEPGRGGESERLSPQSIWMIVKKYAKAAGVDASTHDFRHNKASTLLNRGANLSEVQDLLGHASPATTKLIYARYETAKLREAFDRYSMPLSEAVTDKPDK